MSTSIAHGRRHFKSALGRSKVVQQLLNRKEVERHCRAAGHRWRRSFWSPRTTLLTFLLQTASGVKSLRAAVADLLAHQLVQGARIGKRSADPSAFA